MNIFTTSSPQETAFSVSQLNKQIQQLLEASLPWILVEGEISNLAKPGSGHWYFSLKDDKAQIRCAMFKSKNNAVRFRPKDGDKVRLRARVTFYGLVEIVSSASKAWNPPEKALFNKRLND
ncbi:exodeoxyribonuclease VII large subunit [Marinomonas sp. GJ51-6]|uniref:exodeoxyribonuclease VII large subunit n=1 Tax=Marinomonas sp. GJ51-6 TaxID=2992802 RepID=UPI00293474A4|nr:exodeoxyribonuclease VII large subunit [Marinomonas sp. GJ51-6]WOD06325.1 exodeoxyribonuclease VII large subunit [Marinomonas sp. GJ51-6]